MAINMKKNVHIIRLQTLRDVFSIKLFGYRFTLHYSLAKETDMTAREFFNLLKGKKK